MRPSWIKEILQKKMLSIFHACLKPKGYLFLGMSEALTANINLFKMITKKCKIFEKQVVGINTNTMKSLTDKYIH